MEYFYFILINLTIEFFKIRILF